MTLRIFTEATRSTRLIIRKREGQNVGSGRDCDVLFAVKLIGHRAKPSKAGWLEGPERFAVVASDGYKGAAVIAEEHEAGRRGERAAPGKAMPTSGNSHFSAPVCGSMARRMRFGL